MGRLLDGGTPVAVEVVPESAGEGLGRLGPKLRACQGYPQCGIFRVEAEPSLNFVGGLVRVFPELQFGQCEPGDDRGRVDLEGLGIGFLCFELVPESLGAAANGEFDQSFVTTVNPLANRVKDGHRLRGAPRALINHGDEEADHRVVAGREPLILLHQGQGFVHAIHLQQGVGQPPAHVGVVPARHHQALPPGLDRVVGLFLLEFDQAQHHGGASVGLVPLGYAAEIVSRFLDVAPAKSELRGGNHQIRKLALGRIELGCLFKFDRRLVQSTELDEEPVPDQASIDRARGGFYQLIEDLLGSGRIVHPFQVDLRKALAGGEVLGSHLQDVLILLDRADD